LCKDREIAIVDLFNPTMKECTKSDDDDDDDKERYPCGQLASLTLLAQAYKKLVVSTSPLLWNAKPHGKSARSFVVVMLNWSWRVKV
jgi:hypothetical protein